MSVPLKYHALYSHLPHAFQYSCSIQSDMEWEIEYRKELLKRALYCPLHIKKNLSCRSL
jgi:hypothetical protein